MKLLRCSVRSDEYRVRSNLRVYYDPLDPTQVVARPGDFPGGGAVTVLGAVFVAIRGRLCWVYWNGGA